MQQCRSGGVRDRHRASPRGRGNMVFNSLDRATDRPVAQRIIGIIGGVSDVSTVEYYRCINAGVRKRAGGRNIARTLVSSLNFADVMAALDAGRPHDLERLVEEATDQLLAGGADTILCSSNTCHMAFDPVVARRPDVPHIHIADATAAAMRAAGVRGAVLLGTRFTMEGPHIRARLAAAGIRTVVPDRDDLAAIDAIVLDELCHGVVRDVSRARFVAVTRRLMAQHGVAGVILGCTEIGQLVAPDDIREATMFDTTAIHCEAAVDFALAPVEAAWPLVAAE